MGQSVLLFWGDMLKNTSLHGSTVSSHCQTMFQSLTVYTLFNKAENPF